MTFIPLRARSRRDAGKPGAISRYLDLVRRAGEADADAIPSSRHRLPADMRYKGRHSFHAAALARSMNGAGDFTDGRFSRSPAPVSPLRSSSHRGRLISSSRRSGRLPAAARRRSARQRHISSKGVAFSSLAGWSGVGNNMLQRHDRGAGHHRGSLHQRPSRRWMELPARQKRPPRGEEARMSVSVADAEITPIELEIIYNALTAAAAEMDVTIWRTKSLDHRAGIARLLDCDLRPRRLERCAGGTHPESSQFDELLPHRDTGASHSARQIGVLTTSSYQTTRTAEASISPISSPTRRSFATAGASGSSARCVTISTSGGPHRAVMARARRRFFRKACEYRR